MSNQGISYIIFVSCVFLSSVSQVLLKKGAQRTYNSRVGEYLNPWVICSYGLFFICSLITIIIYKKIPLSLGGILESTGYIFVSVLGVIFLKEKLSKKKLKGMFFIVLGVIIFSI